MTGNRPNFKDKIGGCDAFCVTFAAMSQCKAGGERDGVLFNHECSRGFRYPRHDEDEMNRQVRW